MPRWDQHGGRIINTILECAAYQYTVRATCLKCGHREVFQPHALWWRFERKGWDMRFKRASDRFRCLRCGQSGARLEACRDPVTRDKLPLPPDREWKRQVNRMRG